VGKTVWSWQFYFSDRDKLSSLYSRSHANIMPVFALITDKIYQVSKILFCHETLHVSGIFCAHHLELSSVHVAIGMFHAGYVAAA
jgi:hypothetical protein